MKKIKIKLDNMDKHHQLKENNRIRFQHSREDQMDRYNQCNNNRLYHSHFQ
jgi:hypothetical protein